MLQPSLPTKNAGGFRIRPDADLQLQFVRVLIDQHGPAGCDASDTPPAAGHRAFIRQIQPAMVGEPDGLDRHARALIWKSAVRPPGLTEPGIEPPGKQGTFVGVRPRGITLDQPIQVPRTVGQVVPQQSPA